MSLFLFQLVRPLRFFSSVPTISPPLTPSLLHAYRKQEAREVGLFVYAEEEDTSPLAKNPKQSVQRNVDSLGRSYVH